MFFLYVCAPAGSEHDKEKISTHTDRLFFEPHDKQETIFFIFQKNCLTFPAGTL